MATYHLRRSVLAAIFSATIIAAALAKATSVTEAPLLTEEQTMKLAISTPKPVYPEAARQQHFMGRGSFILNLNPKTGQVTSIKIERRTGHEILDVAALKALINWRFKPNTATKVRIPVNFILGADSIRKTVLDQMFP